MLYNPLAGPFEFFLTVYNAMPVSIVRLINLSLGLGVFGCLWAIFFRSK